MHHMDLRFPRFGNFLMRRFHADFLKMLVVAKVIKVNQARVAYIEKEFVQE
jgi:hypothetical protein